VPLATAGADRESGRQPHFTERAHVPWSGPESPTGLSNYVGRIYVDGSFLEDLRASSLAGTDELLPSGIAGGWPDAFRALTTTLPDSPSIVVIDELPWLAEQDELFDGALQTAWDRLLSRRPVLLLLLGSDIHMMERLTAYDRPFFGRADNMVLGPLNPAEAGGALGLAALAGALPWPEVTTVGGWWNRRFDPEIDLVGADRGPVAQRVDFAGSIKWINSAFDQRDLAALRQGAIQVPGFGPESGLAVVSLSGVAGVDADLVWGPSDIVSSWASSIPRPAERSNDDD
jgi:hypothetical protein